MPIFEYKCNKCGHKMEFLEKGRSTRKHVCQRCNSSDLQNLFRVSLLGKVAAQRHGAVIPVRPERVLFLRKDVL